MEINLLETTTFSTKVDCQLPGEGVDVWRNFSFTATFKVLDEEQQQDLDDRDLSTRDYLREVLVSVDGIPSAQDPKGETISPKEVAIRNQFTQDAAITAYQLKLGRNSRDMLAKTGHDLKNYKRSRR